MWNLIKTWIVLIITLVLAIPVANWTLHQLSAIDGDPGSPLVLADHLFSALLAAVGASIWFGLLALVAGRLTSRTVALFVYGLAWTFVTYRSMPIDHAVRLMAEVDLGFTRTFIMLALETVFWAAPALLVAFALSRVSRRTEEEADQAGLIAPASLAGAGVVFIGCLVIGWLFMRTDLIGQAVFGYAAATGLAVMIVRLLMSHANTLTLVVAPLAAGVVGHASAAFLMGNDALAMVTAGEAWPLARAMPMVYAGSGTLGIAVGVWLGRMFGPEGQAEAHDAVRSATPSSTR